MARKQTPRTLVLTAVLRDGTTDHISRRDLADGEQVNLYLAARTEMDRCAVRDDEHERRICRDERPRTLAVQAVLKVGDRLIDIDEAR